MSWNDLPTIYNHVTMLITRFGYCVLITMLTAELVVASLLLVRYVLERLGGHVLLDKVGRVIMFLYFIPVVFGLIMYYHRGVTPGFTSGTVRSRDDNTFMCTGGMWLIALAFLLIWVVVAVYRYKAMVRQRKKDYGCLKDSVCSQLDRIDLLNRMCREMGIRQQVELRECYGIGSAMTCGICEPKVIIPVRKYREGDLEAVFAHELEHIRRKDLLFRLILNVAVCVFWFCPLIYRLRAWTIRWSETCCDIKAAEQTGDAKTYFGIMARLKSAENNDAPQFTVCMAEGEKIEERIMRMKRYQKGLRAKGRAVMLAVLSLVMVLCGSMTALAAGEGVAEFSNVAYQVLESGDHEEIVDPRVNDGIEYTDNVSGTGENVIVQNPVESYFSTYKNLAWIVPANMISQTPYFTAYNGGYVKIVLEMEPTDKTVYVGIYVPSGGRRYVVVSGEVYHVFELTESGPYSVFVDNPSTTTDVQVVGGYFYE